MSLNGYEYAQLNCCPLGVLIMNYEAFNFEYF